jgi:type I restriction enzyme, R subunit
VAWRSGCGRDVATTGCSRASAAGRACGSLGWCRSPATGPNRAIATQEVIEELIKLARAIEEAKKRGEKLNLSEEELAFYDALAANENAVRAMGDKELQVIAAELVTKVRDSVTIDWTLRENARARIKVMVKRILRKYGYPPDLQDEAVQTVILQAETLCRDWAQKDHA